MGPNDSSQAECLFTLVVVTFRRAGALKQLFLSMERALAEAPSATFEVITVVNGSDSEITAIEEQYGGQSHWQFMHLAMPLPPPQARNEAMKAASGRWLVFLDDDVTLPENYFATLLKGIESSPDAVVIGGPNLNPGDSTPFEKITGLLLGNRFVTGPFSARYCQNGISRRVEGDCDFILCNLVVRRDEAKLFADDLPLGEENALLLEIGSKQMLFLPELFVFHRRRSELSALRKQIIKYGQGRGLLFKRFGWKAESNRRLLLLAAFLLFLMLSNFWPLLAVYLTAVFIISTRVALKEKLGWKGFLMSYVTVLTCHCFYPLGCLRGFFELDISLFFDAKSADKKSGLPTES